MAKSITINGATYLNVPFTKSPLSTGNGEATFWETSDATADAGKTLQGYYAYNASGKYEGSLTVPTIIQDGVTGGLTIS